MPQPAGDEIGLPYGFGCKVRMNINRDVELDGRRQETLIARVVKEAAFGRAVDKSADEAQILYRANKLPNGGIRALHRQPGRSPQSGRESDRWRLPDDHSSRGRSRPPPDQARDRGPDHYSRAPAL